LGGEKNRKPGEGGATDHEPPRTKTVELVMNLSRVVQGSEINSKEEREGKRYIEEPQKGRKQKKPGDNT